MRAQLALAFAEDTLSACLQSRFVRDVVVVTSDGQVQERAVALGAGCLTGLQDGALNRLLDGAVDYVARRTAPPAIAILVADLPALEVAELDAALSMLNRERPSIYVEDLTGGGTTMLASLGTPSGLSFGPDSAARHRRAGYQRAGHEALGLRCDVDTLEALGMARFAGLGPATRRVVNAWLKGQSEVPSDLQLELQSFVTRRHE